MTDALYRDKSRGMIGGVCAGLAGYFGFSPLLLRLISVLWALASETGVVAYILLWFILPDEGALGLSRGEAFRRNIDEIRSEAEEWGRDLQDVFNGKAKTRTTQSKRVILLSSLLILMGLVSLADSFHLLGWFRRDLLGAVALILIGIVFLNRALRNGERRR